MSQSDTHPIGWLRTATQQAGRVKRIVPVLRAALRIGGGPRATLVRAFELYRREGFAGVRRGLAIARNARRAGGLAYAGNRDYQDWISRHDTLTEAGRAALQARAAALPEQPLISVLMPTYNTRHEWLTESIDSVRRQVYPRWELCIADDASTDPALRAWLTHHAAADPRIRVVFRPVNGHICAASNSALELARGAWVALLDHDDVLAEDALLRVAETINDHPRARMIYSDEDKLDARGRRYDPYFKCDWNPELFNAQNLFSHLGVYASDLVREVGGFAAGMEGSQDYDLALRCSERVDAAQIRHIPRVLYHWRAHPASTSQSHAAKPYAQLAGGRALNAHFARLGIDATAQGVGNGYRVRYPLPAQPPLVTLIIPTRNGLGRLRVCLDSVLARTTYPNYEILIVDNGSDHAATLDYLRSVADGDKIRVLRDDRPFNFSALNNAAVRQTRGELVCLLNDDVEVITPDWLSEMASYALRPEIGAVGARLLFPDDTVQHVGVVLGMGSVAGHVHRGLHRSQYGYFGRAVLTHAVSAVTAACLLIRKRTYLQVGGMNETDLKIAFNDIDFCLRVRAAGYRNVLNAYAGLYHHESATRGPDDTPAKRARMAAEARYIKERWGDALETDPAYNPNLSLAVDDMSLAWPPRHGSRDPALQG